MPRQPTRSPMRRTGNKLGRPASFLGPAKMVQGGVPWIEWEMIQQHLQERDVRIALTDSDWLDVYTSDYVRSAVCLLSRLLDGATRHRVIEFMVEVDRAYREEEEQARARDRLSDLASHLAFRFGKEAIMAEEAEKEGIVPEGEAPLAERHPEHQL